ncbi:flagellar assembly peptidoglycan hydrolase FlgJ, partial [Bordetella pertussis]
EAARRIQEAGYATDPRYAEKLISIMGQLRTSVARADFSGGL